MSYLKQINSCWGTKWKIYGCWSIGNTKQTNNLLCVSDNGFWNAHNISVKMSNTKNVSNIFALMRKHLPTCEYYFNVQFK